MVLYYHNLMKEILKSRSLLNLQSSDIKDRLGGRCAIIDAHSYVLPNRYVKETTIHWKVTQDGVSRFVVWRIGHIEYQRLLKLMRKG